MLTLTIPVHRHKNNINIPITLPGMFSLRKLCIDSPNRHTINIMPNCLNVFKKTPLSL